MRRIANVGYVVSAEIHTHTWWCTGLTQTATAENQIARYASTPRSPQTANQPQPIDLAGLASSLERTRDLKTTTPEDIFQAHTCLGWGGWVTAQPGSVEKALAIDPATSLRGMTKGGQSISTWTRICLVKGCYLKGATQSQAGSTILALQTFRSILPWLDDEQATILAQPQLLYWSEQLLGQMALTASKGAISAKANSEDQVGLALQSFRRWAHLASKGQEEPAGTFGNSTAHLSRFSLYEAYYMFLSQLLQTGVRCPEDSTKQPPVRQTTELRTAERLYENSFLRRTRFPQAKESNEAVENWVENVISNWTILCSPAWRGSDLGEGGRNSYGRNVLDILYRAATKTFQSTLILRRLFQIHKFLTDFGLAYRALGTYIELIERGWDRVEKSKTISEGCDDESIVIAAVSEGIEGLCSFGFCEEAESALKLAKKLEKWMPKNNSDERNGAQVNGYVNQAIEEDPEHGLQQRRLNPQTLELGFRATGIAQAHWAKWTPFTENRTTLQAEALSKLNEAVSQRTSPEIIIKGTYALALLLAETRDINGAINCVRSTMSSGVEQSDRNLSKDIALWHLLALLLTAKQEFALAIQTCDAAFDQAGSTPELHQKIDSHQSEKLLELRMTQIALVEVTEGPEEAVNRADELLSLFQELFGYIGLRLEAKQQQQKPLEPPKSSSSIKSFRGSLFGRKKHQRPALQDISEGNGIATIPEKELSRQPTRHSEAPTIQVTDEDEKTHDPETTSPRRSRAVHKDASGHRIHRREGSITRMLRRHSQDRKSKQDRGPASVRKETLETGKERSADGTSVQNDVVHHQSEGANGVRDPSNHQSNQLAAVPAPVRPHDFAQESQQTLEPGSTIQPASEASPTHGRSKSAPQQSCPSPASPYSSLAQPPPQFPPSHTEKRALILLTKIWLMIAALYRRASMYEDSREACDEADKAANCIETLVAERESSARAFATPGWGGGKSSDEVWADVCSERAALSQAVGKNPEAVDEYEQALMYWPDHPRATVGLSNLLLDQFEAGMKRDEKETVTSGRPRYQRAKTSSLTMSGMANGAVSGGSMTGSTDKQSDEELRKTPENLNRLAARDRAYGLLSNLTRLGTGWDDSEAWFALARAHELGGQVEKAKEILWYVVELEDRRPIRHWSNVNCGRGYVL